jgi:hypothetical protein
MQRDHAFRKLQDLILRELQHKHRLDTPGAMEDFLRLAAAKVYYVEGLIRMAECGMSGQQIADRVVCTDP